MAFTKDFWVSWTGIWHSSVRFGFFAKVSFVYCPTLENSLALPCGDSVHIACVSFKDPQLTGPSTVGIISNFIPTSMHSRHEEHCQRFHGSKRLELIPLSWLSLHPCLAQGQVWYMNIVGHISCDSLMNPDLERATHKKSTSLLLDLVPCGYTMEEICSMHCLYCSLLEMSSVILNIQLPYWNLNRDLPKDFQICSHLFDEYHRIV